MHPGRRALFAGALSLSLVGCAVGGGLGPTDPPASTSATAGTAPPAGPVVVGLGGFGSPRTLNPLLDGADTAVLDVIGAAVFASAFGVDGNTRELVPEVVAEIPTTANGGVVAQADGTRLVTYRVAPAARWADGEPITAEDLRFTYEVVTDPALPIRRDERSRYAAVVPGSVAADGPTLQLRMRPGGDPTGLFGIILPAHEVAGTGIVADWNDRMWVGGGPFTFAEWQPGQYLRLRRNLHYAGRDAAGGSAGLYLDKVVYRFFPGSDGAALAEAFASRLVDVAVLAGGADASPYLALAGEGAVLASGPGAAWQALLFQFDPANPNAASLNGEQRFREAVAAAIDREGVARALGTEPVSSLFAGCPPGLAGQAWADSGDGPAEAARLLRDLGEDLGVDLSAGDGPRLVLTVPAGDAAIATAAETVAGMLRAAGIAAEVQLQEAAAFQVEVLPEGTWDVTVVTLACGPELGSAARLVRWFDPDGRPSAGVNLARWGAAASGQAGESAVTGYGRLLKRLEAAPDESALPALLREAEATLAGQMVLVPLAWTSLTRVAYWANGLEGVVADPENGLAGGVARWRRPG